MLGLPPLARSASSLNKKEVFFISNKFLVYEEKCFNVLSDRRKTISFILVGEFRCIVQAKKYILEQGKEKKFILLKV